MIALRIGLNEAGAQLILFLFQKWTTLNAQLTAAFARRIIIHVTAAYTTPICVLEQIDAVCQVRYNIFIFIILKHIVACNINHLTI